MGVALVETERALRGTVCVYEGESQWPEENGVNLVWRARRGDEEDIRLGGPELGGGWVLWMDAPM